MNFFSKPKRKKTLNILGRNFKIRTDMDLKSIQDKFDALMTTLKLVGYDHFHGNIFDTTKVSQNIKNKTIYYPCVRVIFYLNFDLASGRLDREFSMKITLNEKNNEIIEKISIILSGKENSLLRDYDTFDHSIDVLENMLDDFLFHI